MLLALSLPFELKTPLLAVGPLAITNVEVIWYLLLSTAAIRWVRTRSIAWGAVHSAVLLWAVIIVLSALFAPSDRAAACKFALRSVSGCALFFVAADVTITSKPRWSLLIALALGAVISAAAAIAEIFVAGAAQVLSAFKTMPTTMGGWLRAGGTFQYPNTGAMYWEASLPVVLAIGAWWGQRARPVRRWVATGAALILAGAIVLSASRGGMLTALLVGGTLVALPQRVVPGVRLPALIVVLALALGITASGLPSLRLQSPDLHSWYRAEYRTTMPVVGIETDHAFASTVSVRNTGLVAWRRDGDHPVTLGYCWHDPAADATWCSEAPRTRLPHDVPPGAEVVLAIQVVAPAQPGSYVLQWDLVEEGISWFRGYGAQTGDTHVRVGPSATTHPTVTRPRFRPPMPLLSPPGRIELWRAAGLLWQQRPLLGIGPDNFRRTYGKVLELDPNDDRIHANSLYFETLADLGLLGVVALLVLMATLLRTAMSAWHIAGSERRVFAVGLLVAVSTFFAHGVVDYFLPFTPTNGLFWLLTGTTVGVLTAHRVRE